MLGFRELVIILLIVLVVFGTKRLISAGGDLGKAIQSFKKGMRDAQEEPGKLDPPPAQGSGDPYASMRKDNDRPGP
jgi:sec-independent protein translocase protein TatA